MRSLSLFLCFVLSASAYAADRPNIVVILADDLGYSDIGCYGSEIQTPNLDNLAKNGLRFTQFYNTARCCPTRASLLTGLYPHQAGMGHMTGNVNEYPGYRAELARENAVTIAEVLKLFIDMEHNTRMAIPGRIGVPASVTTMEPARNDGGGGHVNRIEALDEETAEAALIRGH